MNATTARTITTDQVIDATGRVHHQADTAIRIGARVTVTAAGGGTPAGWVGAAYTVVQLNRTRVVLESGNGTRRPVSPSVLAVHVDPAPSVDHCLQCGAPTDGTHGTCDRCGELQRQAASDRVPAEHPAPSVDPRPQVDPSSVAYPAPVGSTGSPLTDAELVAYAARYAHDTARIQADAADYAKQGAHAEATVLTRTAAWVEWLRADALSPWRVRVFLAHSTTHRIPAFMATGVQEALARLVGGPHNPRRPITSDDLRTVAHGAIGGTWGGAYDVTEAVAVLRQLADAMDHAERTGITRVEQLNEGRSDMSPAGVRLDITAHDGTDFVPAGRITGWESDGTWSRPGVTYAYGCAACVAYGEGYADPHSATRTLTEHFDAAHTVTVDAFRTR